jgi:single-stranded DNA-specific DHH superfamily exonuclease
VVGLVAARLKEKFARPVFAIALEPGGIGTGSGRPRPYFDAEYTYYEFEVEVFTPDRARSMSRLAGTPSFP